MGVIRGGWPMPGQMTIATIIEAAEDAGCPFALTAQTGSAGPSPIVGLQFTGEGADVWNGRKFAETFRDKLMHIHETGEWLWLSPQQG